MCEINSHLPECSSSWSGPGELGLQRCRRVVVAWDRGLRHWEVEKGGRGIVRIKMMLVGGIG